MTIDLSSPNVWFSHLLEHLPEEKLASILTDDNPDWEYIDGEIVKLGSLGHGQLDIREIQRRGLKLLASESKDFRLLTQLLRTLQHMGEPLLAIRLLSLYVQHFWTVAAPKIISQKQRLAFQILKRFESGVGSFAKEATTRQRDDLLAEIAKLAQGWQEHNATELAEALDALSELYRRAFRDVEPVQTTLQTTHFADTPLATNSPPLKDPGSIAPFPVINIDSHDDKAWRDTLLKVASLLCERQPDSPHGYRLRRLALWLSITGSPQAESDGRTQLAAVSADMVADYQIRLSSADLLLWQQIEKSLLLAPYWLEGHYLSAQAALRLGYADVAEAIRDEVAHFANRLPQLATLLFNDHTPFMTLPTQRWLAASSGRQDEASVSTNEDMQAVRQCFNESGLESALHYLDALPEGSPRDRFYRQYFGAQLMEDAGMMQLAQQQYRTLFRVGTQMMLADWEPSLLDEMENKLTAER